MAEDTKNTAKIHVKKRTKPFQITVEEDKNNSVNNERTERIPYKKRTNKKNMDAYYGRKKDKIFKA